MSTRSVAAAFSTLIGLSMIGMWTVLLATGQVPELRTEPFSIAYHLGAEFSTALTLLVGGIGLFRKTSWGSAVYLASMGMLFYATVNSAGYYADKGEWPMIIMFGVFTILAVVSAGLIIFNKLGDQGVRNKHV